MGEGSRQELGLRTGMKNGCIVLGFNMRVCSETEQMRLLFLRKALGKFSLWGVVMEAGHDLD